MLFRSPVLKCWGRLEGGKLTALVLRDKKEQGYEYLNSYEWTGRWAIISQDDMSISESSVIAVVPFDEGSLSMKLKSKPKIILSVGINLQQEKKDWTWENGELKLTITNNELNNIAGFIIK